MEALASSPSAPDPLLAPLPALRQDLHVQRVGAFRDGSPRFRIHDALRNRFFELGILEVEILAEWHAGDTPVTVAARAAEHLGTDIHPEEVLAVRDFLLRHQLMDGRGAAAFELLRQMWQSKRQHWLTWLLHHYLFFRVPLVRPDAWLVRMLPWARRLVSRPARIGLLVAALVTPVMVAHAWTEYLLQFAGLFTFDGLLASAVAAFFAKILHELGHAFVARHYGVRVPVMGLAFLVMWPVFYTDTSESWKLADHRARFRIAAAGVATELAIALLALLLWALTPPGGMRSALFFLSTTSLLITLSINASPFMRFDGYFLLSDAMDFPNLHERSGAMARWWMRRALWGLDVPPPEQHSRRMARFLIVFAYVTWLYRAIVFLGIAVLVYLAFFKLLGILLMAVELVWFLAQPVWTEARAVWQLRASLRPRWVRLSLLLGAIVATVLVLAWSGESRAPALLLAAEETRLYPPSPSQVEMVGAKSGQPVGKDQVLLVLRSPDLAYRAQYNAVRIARLQGELARIPASERQRDRSLVFQEELAEALSEQEAIASESALLTMKASHPGRLVDVPSDIAPGRWVSPRQLLGRVVDGRSAHVRAWVSETQVRRLKVGEQVTFVPRRPEERTVHGRVLRIDGTGSRTLPHPLLDGANGGDLTATQDTRGEWKLQQTLYQVEIETEAGVRGPLIVEPGNLMVPTGLWDAVAAGGRQALTVLVRESGF